MLSSDMDGTARADRYIEGVLSGDIIAPLFIKQACERHQADLERDDIWFDVDTAINRYETLND